MDPCLRTYKTLGLYRKVK